MYFFFLMKQNPYLVKVYSYKISTEKGLLYSIEEFCMGGNLEQYLMHFTEITENDILLIFYDILKSVKAIHDSGYLHGDIKLENILMCNGDSAKLRSFRSRVLMNTQAVKRGTPLYMPPEAMMDLYRPREFFFQKSFDNYALGVLLYFMLHLKFPFYGHDFESHILAMRNREIEIDPSLSPLSKTLLATLLSFDQTKRNSTKSILTLLRYNIPVIAFSSFKNNFSETVYKYNRNGKLVPIYTGVNLEREHKPAQFEENLDKTFQENLMVVDTPQNGAFVGNNENIGNVGDYMGIGSNGVIQMANGIQEEIADAIAAAERMEKINQNFDKNKHRQTIVKFNAEKIFFKKSGKEDKNIKV